MRYNKQPSNQFEDDDDELFCSMVDQWEAFSLILKLWSREIILTVIAEKQIFRKTKNRKIAEILDISEQRCNQDIRKNLGWRALQKYLTVKMC